MDINWSAIPTHNIDVGKLTDPTDICALMKQHKIRQYVYRIKYKGLVIKYGMSTDNSKAYGDRVYRQIAHAASWGTRRINGPNGADWRVVEEDFKNTYGFELDKKHLTIQIYNMTNYPFTTVNHRDEVYFVEQELIEEYRRLVGEKPIVNLHDDTLHKRRGYIKKDTFGGLFDL
jgi:hypothetical protein